MIVISVSFNIDPYFSYKNVKPNIISSLVNKIPSLPISNDPLNIGSAMVKMVGLPYGSFSCPDKLPLNAYNSPLYLSVTKAYPYICNNFSNSTCGNVSGS